MRIVNFYIFHTYSIGRKQARTTRRTSTKQGNNTKLIDVGPDYAKVQSVINA